MWAGAAWPIVTRRPSHVALLAARIQHMCAEMGADRGDRAEALAVILGAVR